MPTPLDPEARNARFAHLFREHAAAVYRTLLSCGVPAADAEEHVTRVFELVLEHLDEIRPGAERSYVCGVAARVAANVRRRLRRRTERFASLAHDELEALLPDSGGVAPSPEQDAIRAHGLRLLTRALEEMSEAQRTVFVLCELERRSTAEAAAALGIAETAVESRRRKARAAFARFCARLREAERAEDALGQDAALRRLERGT
jgi:RNA polymerase sigma-70 factor (ECF subfamily)